MNQYEVYLSSGFLLVVEAETHFEARRILMTYLHIKKRKCADEVI